MEPPGQFVICGDSPLAYRLAVELTERYGEDVTVILPSVLDNYGPGIARLPRVTVIEAARLSVATFTRAGLDRAGALALVQQGDAANIHAAMRARDVNPGLRIVLRMTSVSLGGRMEKLFGNCAALSDAVIAAPAFVVSALDDPTANVLQLPGQTLQVTHRFNVPKNRVLCGLAITTGAEPELFPAHEGSANLVLALPKDNGHGFRPLPLWSVVRNRLWLLTTRRVWITVAALFCTLFVFTGVWAALTGDSVFHSLYLMLMTAAGTTQPENMRGGRQIVQLAVTLLGLAVLFPVVNALGLRILDSTKLARTLRSRPYANHVIVVGLGQLGYRVVQMLRQQGHSVIAVDSNENASGVQGARELNVNVIIKDASRRDTLREARIETCQALLAITSDDATNLDVALLGRELRGGDLWVALRLFENDLAKRVEESFGISKSRSVSYLAAPVFAAALIGQELIGTIPVGRRVLLIAELEVAPGSELAGAPIRAAELAGEVRVIALLRGRDTTWRTRLVFDEALRPGDKITVAATRVGLAELLPRAV